jgi:hypothetical protein
VEIGDWEDYCSIPLALESTARERVRDGGLGRVEEGVFV